MDTNVLVTALRSNKGASFQILQLVGSGRFEHVVTVPLVMEYEDVLQRPGMTPLPDTAVADVLDYMCSSGVRQSVHFLWRPRLTDVKDDMVLEAAMNGACTAIITWNVRDFALAGSMGLAVWTPEEFLKLLKEQTP